MNLRLVMSQRLIWTQTADLTQRSPIDPYGKIGRGRASSQVAFSGILPPPTAPAAVWAPPPFPGVRAPTVAPSFRPPGSTSILLPAAAMPGAAISAPKIKCCQHCMSKRDQKGEELKSPEGKGLETCHTAAATRTVNWKSPSLHYRSAAVCSRRAVYKLQGRGYLVQCDAKQQSMCSARAAVYM